MSICEAPKYAENPSFHVENSTPQICAEYFAAFKCDKHMSEYQFKRTKHFIRKEFGNSFVEKGTVEKVKQMSHSEDCLFSKAPNAK